MIKRLFLGCLLGGCILPSLVGMVSILLIIILAISMVPNLPQIGPGTNQQTNAVQTDVWTGMKNDAVVLAGRMLVQTLYACGENGHDKCYTAAFPANALEYLYEACGNPQCPYAQNGNFQCVFFVLAVYFLAHQTLPFGPDAVNFWHAYQNTPGWIEIPANGKPSPGDIAVFSGPADNPQGHVAIIIDMANPGNDGTGGYIQLAEANSEQAVADLPFIQTNTDPKHPIWQVTAWAGYRLLGYIRNATNG